uniref:uncharacterized protein si:busm1-163l24.3 isoform X2 n=1 Tax=Scatophagus argus TaxID=75038 RepID=UPI001ED800F1|nr:uncharacterized protein si:busm1-163l24.3 isoform X2 [Scatophagus argus]
MAEPGRTVRVSGLPTDTDDDRLKDKLFIHFLRKRNGGGEIESVTIVKATPVSALITFEDSRVAQRVIQHGPHVLEVDGKQYEVTITEHLEKPDPDKVILNLSGIVDCGQLPGGVMALTSLHKSHPDIQINPLAEGGLYTVRGPYSKVQDALAQLLGQPGRPQSTENKESGQPVNADSSYVLVGQKPQTQESEDRSRKLNKQREQREKVRTDRSSDEYNSGSHRDLTPGGYGWEDTGQTEGAALQLPEPPAMSQEDFLLIVDADMFQYLQKHHRKEYQRILTQHGVDVVDMTSQGLTSLYLQVATAAGEDGQDQECLKLARNALSVFFQENETRIHRAQLPKSILSPRGGLQRAKENLCVRFPKLLLNEDDRNIYIVGSISDVSDAKQFLMEHNEVRAKKEDVSSLLRFPSYDLGSPAHADEQRVPLSTSSTLDPVNDRIDQLLRSEEDEKRAEGARRYKLAARFKDTGLAALGSRPTDFSLRGGLSSSSRQTRLGPVLGHDVLSDTAENAGQKGSRALAQNTGGDILFKSGDALPSAASTQNKPSLNSHVIDNQPKTLTSPLSTPPSNLSGRTSLPSAVSGSTLKRASSFSGTPRQKAHVTGQRSQDDTDKPTVRARTRSSSFTHQMGRDKQGGYNAEITLSFVMWQHIKEAYSSRVDDLTSDVQMKASRPGGSSDLTLTLIGANSSKVSSCQQGLQKLIDSVGADFSVLDLHLSELGITNPSDETLQACCAEVRSRFKKITIQIFKTSLFLLGPKQLCSQVGALLREVFSGDLAQMPDQQNFSTTSTSNGNLSLCLQMNEDQRTTPQVMLESQTSKADGTGCSQEKRTNNRSDFQETELVNGSVSQPLVRKDPVVKEKVKVVGTVEIDGQKTETSVRDPRTANDESAKRVNGVRSTETRTDEETVPHAKPRPVRFTQKEIGQKRRTEIGETTEESRVCHETEPTKRGIQGIMSHAKLNISIPGCAKDSAIKITYRIPDGIQGEGHPSPGKPFQGGVFEAFLPDCEKTKKLLPRLEKAFRHGLTFTVIEKETGGRVAWDCIPHKTSLCGGKSGNSYPDSTYLTRLSEVLTSHGIEETPAKS